MKTGRSLKAIDRLEKAYFEMLETTHYSKISVSDIIEKAGVSRTTFYRHYDDIFDMHKKISDKLSSTIINQCIKQILTYGENVYSMVVKNFTSQDKYIKLLSGENGSRYLFENVYNHVIKYALPAMKFLPEEMIFRLKFITIATIGVYVKDILEDREHNTDFIEICKAVIDLDKIQGGNYGK